MAAFPSAANPAAWRGLAETADTFVIEQVNLVGEVLVAHFLIIDAQSGPVTPEQPGEHGSHRGPAEHDIKLAFTLAAQFRAPRQ